MIKFGPSGNSESFIAEKHKSTVEAAAWCKARGLDWYEYSFGRGVNLGDEKAKEIGEAFKSCDIGLSAHAPYFINLANEDDEKASNSFNYILDSARACRIMQGDRVVFHPASQGKLTREKAVSLTIDRMKILRDLILKNSFEDMKFCPETMGKLGQIGTIEEITEFCKLADFFVPTVDFGHVNAREQGSLKTVADYKSRLEYMIGELGYEKMKNFHVHFYLAFGEHRADRADGRAAAARGERAQLLGAHAEPVCHDLEKTPRSGGALVVHKKVLHRAAGYADDLRILPADVDHEKIVPPVQKARAARVAGDLRDALSGVRHGDAPVPCRNTGVRFRRKVRRFELGTDALRRVHTAPARRPRR